MDAASVDRALEGREKRLARGMLLGLASHVGTYVVVIGGLTLLDIAGGPVAAHTLGMVMTLLRREELPAHQDKYAARKARTAAGR